MKYTLSDFDYKLPEDLIADTPLEKRSESRLMVLNRKTETIEHRIFKDILKILTPQDILILNNTKVFKARLLAQKETGGQVEIFFLHRLSENRWEALMSGTGKIKEGLKITWQNAHFRVLKKRELEESALYEIDVDYEGDFFHYLDKFGLTPLPPYIRRSPRQEDIWQYQTVFAEHNGAVAAPTAGLHFTSRLLDELREEGVSIETLLLHVGYGTFSPVRLEKLEDHQMHQETFEVYPETSERINKVREKGGRVVACGTTVLRALESSLDSSGMVQASTGKTNLFIYPPYQIKSIDALITNFHLPKSSLLMLVSAFGGYEFIKEAYQEAIREKYRFYSYGDAMLIL